MNHLKLGFLAHSILFLAHSILVVRPWNFFVSVFLEYECVTCYNGSYW